MALDFEDYDNFIRTGMVSNDTNRKKDTMTNEQIDQATPAESQATVAGINVITHVVVSILFITRKSIFTYLLLYVVFPYFTELLIAMGISNNTTGLPLPSFWVIVAAYICLSDFGIGIERNARIKK